MPIPTTTDPGSSAEHGPGGETPATTSVTRFAAGSLRARLDPAHGTGGSTPSTHRAAEP